jgi:hypothetical protein
MGNFLTDCKCDIMKEPDENSNGSQKPACKVSQQKISLGDSGHCPLVGYEPGTSTDAENRINTAFDILFQEVVRVRKSNNTHEINRHLRQGLNRPARRGTNH